MKAHRAEDIGSIARQRRLDLGLSQDDLASTTGVTRQWISRFEQARTDVSLSKVLAILRELGLSVDIHPRHTSPATAIPRVQVMEPQLSAAAQSARDGLIRSTTSQPAAARSAYLRLQQSVGARAPEKDK